jgi:hypothetical protein
MCGLRTVCLATARAYLWPVDTARVCRCQNSARTLLHVERPTASVLCQATLCPRSDAIIASLQRHEIIPRFTQPLTNEYHKTFLGVERGLCVGLTQPCRRL